MRPLGHEVDKAFALLTSLDETQRKQAILGFQIRDLVLGPGRDGQTIQPEGIKGSDLTEKQREMLLDLASEWTGIMHESVAAAKMAEMKKNVADTWFAWSGPTEKGSAAYFRIQGPTVFIEFAPQRLGGDANKHIHTIYRDPTNDYGRVQRRNEIANCCRCSPRARLATPAFAHRLDEYLQATLFTVERDHIAISMRLTPGVEVLPWCWPPSTPAAMASFQCRKQRAYAEKVRRDLSLSIDGRPVPLRLVEFTFPALEEMKQGLGEIVLRFDVPIPPGGARRRLVFENHHLPAISVYLANCLVPTDPSIRVIAQDRNVNQSIYQLDYSQADDASSALTAADAPAVAGWLESTGSESLFKAFFYAGVRHILTGYDHLLFVGARACSHDAVGFDQSRQRLYAGPHYHPDAGGHERYPPARAHRGTADRRQHRVCRAPKCLLAAPGPGLESAGRRFFFGLFHGLGFAGGLLDAMREMPSGTMFVAIFAFSLGIEAGHQMVVLPLFA